MFRLADILNFSNSFYVIDAEVVDGNSYNYSLASMTRKNEDVDFSFPVLNSRDIEEIQKNIPDEANVGIVINGKGTLYRTLKECAEEDNSALLNRILPDANVDDYYLQRLNTPTPSGQKGNTILSIVRKELADSIINQFKSRVHLVAFSVGPFIFDNLLSVLSLPPHSSVAYKNIQVEIGEEGITGFMPQQDDRAVHNLELADQTFNSDLLPSLALGFAFLLGEECNYAGVDSVYQCKEESQYRQKSINLIRIFLPALFVLLLCSYFLFDHYYSKVEELNSQITLNEQLINRLEELKESYASKSKFLQQSGLLSDTKYAYYLDLFASHIPSSIVLEDITINPKIKKSALSKEIAFERNIMQVTGSSFDSYKFNAWIKKLKEIEEFKEVNILEYEYQDSESCANFSIKILL